MKFTRPYFILAYDIAITTTDKQEAGMSHHAWLILEGDQRISKELVMENSSRTKLFKKYVNEYYLY